VAEATTLLLCRKLPEAQNQTAQPNGVDPVPFTLGTLAGTGKASRVYRQHSRADRARPDAQRASGQGRRGATSSAFRSEKMRAGSEGRAGHMHPACGVQCRRYEVGVGRLPRTAPHGGAEASNDARLAASALSLSRQSESRWRAMRKPND